MSRAMTDQPEFRIKLTDEQKRIVGSVRALTQGEFKARGLKYMDGSFPWENIRALAELGVLGMAVPEAYGGSEFGVFDTALVLEEIAKGCYVTAMAVLGEVGTQTRIIAAYAPEPVKQRPQMMGVGPPSSDRGVVEGAANLVHAGRFH